MAPRLPGNLRTERLGVLAVATELNRLGLIWRETPMADVGIDGQIEVADDDGRLTGRLVAAQIKSGVSYFRDGGSDEWRFTPDPAHRFYWERFPLPVLLFLHSPADGTFWIDVRQALRSPERGRHGWIGVPKGNLLQETSREAFLASVAAASRPFLPVADVLGAMAKARSPSASLAITYLDLFANGLTNIAGSVYYGMDLVVEVAEVLGEGEGIGLGAPEDEFLFGYLQFLVEQQIADIDIDDCLIDWVDRQMHSTFIAPLTSRGRELVRLIHQAERRFVEEGRLTLPEGLSLAQETFVRMHFTAVDYARMPLIQHFGQRLLDRGASEAA